MDRITCKEFQAINIGRTAEKDAMDSMTRAERARWYRHGAHCQACVFWATTEGPVIDNFEGSHIRKRMTDDLFDPEFREVVEKRPEFGYPEKPSVVPFEMTKLLNWQTANYLNFLRSEQQYNLYPFAGFKTGELYVRLEVKTDRDSWLECSGDPNKIRHECRAGFFQNIYYNRYFEEFWTAAMNGKAEVVFAVDGLAYTFGDFSIFNDWDLVPCFA